MLAKRSLRYDENSWCVFRSGIVTTERDGYFDSRRANRKVHGNQPCEMAFTRIRRARIAHLEICDRPEHIPDSPNVVSVKYGSGLLRSSASFL